MPGPQELLGGSQGLGAVGGAGRPCRGSEDLYPSSGAAGRPCTPSGLSSLVYSGEVPAPPRGAVGVSPEMRWDLVPQENMRIFQTAPHDLTVLRNDPLCIPGPCLRE